jgi:hypothetical protein
MAYGRPALYMSETTAGNLLGAAGTLAAPGSLLGADLVNKDLLGSPAMRPLLAALTVRGASGRFGLNDPEGLLARHGWKAEATQRGEWGPTTGGGPTR